VGIDCEQNPDLPVAFAGTAQMQVLFNLLVDAYEAMSRAKEPKKLPLRTDFTDDHFSLQVQINGGWVTTVDHLLEIVADESREQSWPSQSVVSSSQRKRSSSKLFDKKEK
jgi:hypothetical protein